MRRPYEPLFQHSSHDSTPGDSRKHKLTNITITTRQDTTPPRLPTPPPSPLRYSRYYINFESYLYIDTVNCFALDITIATRRRRSTQQQGH